MSHFLESKVAECAGLKMENIKLKSKIAELEKERDALLVRVTNCEQIFSSAPDLEFSNFKEMFPDEMKAHNLEQQAKGVDLLMDYAGTEIGYYDVLGSQMVKSEDILAFHKQLKEGE